MQFKDSHVLDEHASLFSRGPGHCRKIKAHIELKEGAQPMFKKPFFLSLAMHDILEAELQSIWDNESDRQLHL